MQYSFPEKEHAEQISPEQAPLDQVTPQNDEIPVRNEGEVGEQKSKGKGKENEQDLIKDEHGSCRLCGERVNGR